MKLLRVVKRRKTACKLLKAGGITIFYKKVFGYNNGKLSRVVISNMSYEIFQGIFTNYPFPLKETEEVILFKCL